ncbi:MAG: alpha/beta fold hydrolase [Acidimicrobiales bacterium]
MVNLEWEQHGDGPDTLVWGHGLTSSRPGDDSGPLAGIMPAVTEAGWRCVRYDARGHGGSPAPHDPDVYRWERLATDMLAVADAAGAERFCAAGASMGAATSLYAALTAPARVSSLVLVIPPTAWATRAAQREAYETMAAVVEAKGIERLVAAVAEQPPTTLFGSEGQRRTIDNLRAMDPDAYPFVMRGAAASDLPGLDAIATIDVPALVLAWSDDTGHPVSTAEQLATALPHGELSVARSVDEVGAWPGAIAGFLRRIAA